MTLQLAYDRASVCGDTLSRITKAEKIGYDWMGDYVGWFENNEKRQDWI